MKKILTVCIALMLATTMFSKEYKYSVGMVAGSGIGAQFKTMITKNFTIIDEFGYFGCWRGGGSNLGGYFGMLDQAVFAYQAKAAQGQNIRLDYFVGGQLKAGYLTGNGGVIGFGAAGGIEAIMTNAPMAFSFDFRPGYAVGLYPGNAFFGTGTFADHMFDWTFNLSVRYTF